MFSFYSLYICPPLTTRTQHRERSADPVEVVGLFDFAASQDDELSFAAGDTLTLTDHSNASWFRAERNGKTGFIPCNYVVGVEPFAVPRDGTFLVWPLMDGFSPLCLSLRHCGHIDHVRISMEISSDAIVYRLRRASTFAAPPAATSLFDPCDAETFSSLAELITFYRKHPLPWLPCGTPHTDLRLMEAFSRDQLSR